MPHLVRSRTPGWPGPDTGSNRADLDYLLSNVLDPSALIGKDYLAHVIAMTDGRVLTGIIRAEDKDTITLMTANETITLPKSEFEQRKTSEQSMMPGMIFGRGSRSRKFARRRPSGAAQVESPVAGRQGNGP